MPRNYSNTAIDTTLMSSVLAADTVLTVASASGWPAAPFAAVLDSGGAAEEVVQVTSAVGTSWTVTRGFDGTTAANHSAGAIVRHSAIAADFEDLQAADAATNALLANYLLNSNYDWSTLPNKPATFPPSAHTQAASTITDFAEAVDDRVAVLIVPGANINTTYDDVAGTLTIDASGGGGGGTPGGADTQLQYNNAGAFAGDSGLTYNATTKELTISGNTDKTTNLLTAHGGDFHATVTTETFIPNADLTFTAVDVGTAGNDIVIVYTFPGTDQPLSITVTAPTITMAPATDSGGASISTASDVMTALNADPDASALIVTTLAPGNDGTGIVPTSLFTQLAGGATAADAVWVDERGRLNVQPQTGLGDFALNIRDSDGAIVAHMDTDGGFGFANEHFQMSQGGTMTVNTEQPLPLQGNATLIYQINGSTLFNIAAGGGYSFSVFCAVPSDIVFSVAAATGQTGDLFAAYDENFLKTVRILSNGDLQMDRPELGVILIDRTDATPYRLYVDSGTLQIEAV